MKHRTDKEILDQTNVLANKIYMLLGYQARKGYEFHKATHPQEIMCWDMACEAQMLLTETDIENVLANLE